MRNWSGIQLDTAATDPGTVFAVNVNYFVTGEVRRRLGMVGFTPVSGIAISSFQNPMTGQFAIFATSTGTVEAVAAP